MLLSALMVSVPMTIHSLRAGASHQVTQGTRGAQEPDRSYGNQTLEDFDINKTTMNNGSFPYPLKGMMEQFKASDVPGLSEAMRTMAKLTYYQSEFINSDEAQDPMELSKQIFKAYLRRIPCEIEEKLGETTTLYDAIELDASDERGKWCQTECVSGTSTESRHTCHERCAVDLKTFVKNINDMCGFVHSIAGCFSMFKELNVGNAEPQDRTCDIDNVCFETNELAAHLTATYDLLAKETFLGTNATEITGEWSELDDESGCAALEVVGKLHDEYVKLYQIAKDMVLEQEYIARSAAHFFAGRDEATFETNVANASAEAVAGVRA